ncbi:MAG TPA: hypothetical protein VFO92_00445 [Nitrososphaeraceae archaeon]|nr:hypothetical protein [Nitrososphaeraceae archaeon]
MNGRSIAIPVAFLHWIFLTDYIQKNVYRYSGKTSEIGVVAIPDV